MIIERFAILMLFLLLCSPLCASYTISHEISDRLALGNRNIVRYKTAMAQRDVERATTRPMIDIFRDVVRYKNVSTEAVKEALKSLDISTPLDSIKYNQRTQTSSKGISGVIGEWELIYSSLIPIGYLPLYEILEFYPAFKLTSSFYGIPLGNVKGLSAIVRESNPLQLNLTTTEFRLGFINIVYDREKLKVKLYTFLYVDEEVCVAKSSLGGFSIFKRSTGTT